MKKSLLVIAMVIMSQTAQAGILWEDGFETYPVYPGNFNGAAGVPWTNVSPISGNGGRIFKWSPTDPAGLWDIGANKSAILIGLVSNNAWYSRNIGQVGASEQVVLTGQVASYGHPDTVGHTSWPLAAHISIGGVALGIQGDRIHYQLINGPTTFAVGNGVRLAAGTAAYKTWYDVKIVINQVSGTNNDTADLYYKASTASDWTQIVQGLATGSDLGTKVHLASYGQSTTLGTGSDGYRQGAIDNVSLSTIPEPATMAILGLGALFLARRK